MKICYRSAVGILAGLYLAGILVSCNSTSEHRIKADNRECYSIDPSMKRELDTSMYSIDSILPLKVPEDIVELYVSKISVINGNIYLLDPLITNKLYTFDCRGNLMATIGERGHARGEFVGKPDDFFVDGNDKVHVFDKIGHRINVYDKDGTADDVIGTEYFFPHSIGLTSNGKYMMYFTRGHERYDFEEDNDNNETDSPSALLLLDNKCKDYKQLMPSKGELHCSTSLHTFFQDNERLSFIPPFSDSVFVFKADTIEKIVSFDFGGKVLCKEMPEKPLQKEDWSFMDNYKGVLGLDRYQETESLVYLEYCYQQYQQRWLYDKRNGQAFCGSMLFEGIDPYRYYCIDGKRIIAFVTRETIEWLRRSYENRLSSDKKIFRENLEKSPKELTDLLESRIEGPVLVYITLK